MVKENIDVQHKLRRKSIVSEKEHTTAGYTEYSNRVTL